MAVFRAVDSELRFERLEDEVWTEFGDPLDPATQLGPMASAPQLQRVSGGVDRGPSPNSSTDRRAYSTRSSAVQSETATPTTVSPSSMCAGS